LNDAHYRALLERWTALRAFLRERDHAATEAGVTPIQHELLVAVRGHPDRRGPTVGEVARYLGLRHNSTVGLVDRAAAAGLVTRRTDDEDRRVVRLRLTPAGRNVLAALAAQHRNELSRLENIDRVIEKANAKSAKLSTGRRGTPSSRLR
jgi:DNA-binding MarR family transcriptional regulator